MKIIDLSQLIHAEMPVFPGAAQPQFQQLARVETNGFRVANATMNYHVGTHMDAPAHMMANGKTLDAFSVDRFTGKAAIADFTNLSSETINLEAIQKFESILHQVEYLLLKTGWSEYWGSEQYFKKYPTLTPEAAKWLTGFPLKGIGLDAISIDPITSADFAIHRILLGKEILIVENLNNLNAIDVDFFEFFSMPLWIKHADGSPVRAVAIIC
jgi:arylformamidase